MVVNQRQSQIVQKSPLIMISNPNLSHIQSNHQINQINQRKIVNPTQPIMAQNLSQSIQKQRLPQQTQNIQHTQNIQNIQNIQNTQNIQRQQDIQRQDHSEMNLEIMSESNLLVKFGDCTQDETQFFGKNIILDQSQNQMNVQQPQAEFKDMKSLLDCVQNYMHKFKSTKQLTFNRFQTEPENNLFSSQNTLKLLKQNQKNQQISQQNLKPQIPKEPTFIERTQRKLSQHSHFNLITENQDSSIELDTEEKPQKETSIQQRMMTHSSKKAKFFQPHMRCAPTQSQRTRSQHIFQPKSNDSQNTSYTQQESIFRRKESQQSLQCSFSQLQSEDSIKKSQYFITSILNERSVKNGDFQLFIRGVLQQLQTVLEEKRGFEELKGLVKQVQSILAKLRVTYESTYFSLMMNVQRLEKSLLAIEPSQFQHIQEKPSEIEAYSSLKKFANTDSILLETKQSPIKNQIDIDLNSEKELFFHIAIKKKNQLPPGSTKKQVIISDLFRQAQSENLQYRDFEAFLNWHLN